MKKLLLSFFLACFPLSATFSYPILYAEEYYQLYHQHLYQYSDDIMENIFYLEKALEAPFCNPLYALAKINNKAEWKHYRYLFTMHIYLKLVEQYLRLGSRYDKMVAYFYNAPWKAENLQSLAEAEKIYRLARGYWKEAVQLIRQIKRSFINLEEIQQWEDEYQRIISGELDYDEIIDFQLTRLGKVRKAFEQMDKTTY